MIPPAATTLLNTVLGLFGAWTLLALVLTLLGQTFTMLVWLSLLPAVLFPIFLRLTRPGRKVSPATTGSLPKAHAHWPVSRTWLPALAVALTLTLTYAVSRSAWLFWLPSAIYLLILCCFLDAPAGSSRRSPPPPQEKGVQLTLILLGLVAILATLGTNRPDADDAFFLSLVTGTLDNPEAPLHAFDHLYRSGLPLVEQHLHLVQSYELLVALLSTITGASPFDLYYLFLPAGWSVLAVLAGWAVLRRFLDPWPAVLGVAALLILLLTWGDGHRTYGNFGLVRIFQGKSIFLLVSLPLLFLSALNYLQTPNTRHWGMLALHQAAAVGLTTNALVVAPAASALVLVSGFLTGHPRQRKITTLLGGLMASLPLLPAAACLSQTLSQYPAPEHFDQILLGYEVVFGNTRTPWVLFGLLATPLAVKLVRAKEMAWLSGYLFLTATLLLFPPVQQLAGKLLASVFSWRIYWAWPVPLLLAITIGACWSGKVPHPLLFRTGSLAFLVTFALAGPMAVTPGNWAVDNLGRYKVLPPFEVARQLASLAGPRDRVLAPESVAVYLTAFPRHPPLVAVRKLYLNKLRGTIPNKEWNNRRRLLSLIEGRARRLDQTWLITQLHRFRISMLAFPDDHPQASRLEQLLADNGFQMMRTKHYTIAKMAAGLEKSPKQNPRKEP